jgi:hypothetical protein
MKESSILNARWPEAGPIDEALVEAKKYLFEVAHDFRLQVQKNKSKVCSCVFSNVKKLILMLI